MIDYYRCIRAAYPTITDNDFELVSDERGLILTNWNPSFGPVPSFTDLDQYWLDVIKKDKISEMTSIMYNELVNGTSGFQIQLHDEIFRIDSGRTDLDNMKILKEYCERANLSFTNGTMRPEIGSVVVDSITGASGTVSSIAIQSGDWATNTAAGMIYLNGCTGTFGIGNTLRTTTAIAVISDINKSNADSTTIRDFDNNYHSVMMCELESIIIQLQGYGLWLYQNKWAKEQVILNAATEEEVNAVTFF